MRRALLGAVAAIALACAPALAGEPKQGGQVVVAFNNDLTTLDPHVGYDWQNWSVIKTIFDGLMDYKPGTTELEPDLAQSFTFHKRSPLNATDGRMIQLPRVRAAHSEAADRHLALRNRIHLAIGTAQRRHDQRATFQTRGVVEHRHRDIQLAPFASEFR